MQQYDLVVIGSGPGGQRAAIQAAKAKKRVAVVEKQTMVGGVCINTGTIPSKTMREAVLHLSGFYDQAFYGSNYHVKENITMNDLNFRVTRVIENEAAVLQDQLQAQWGRSVPRNRFVHRSASHPRREHHRLQRTGSGIHSARHRHETRRESKGSHQRPEYRQQRSDPGHTGGAENLDRCGRWRNRCGVRLHVHDARRARNHCREAAQAPRIRGRGSGRGAQLPHARSPRHHAVDGRSGKRGRNARRQSGRESGQQETDSGRRTCYTQWDGRGTSTG